MNRLMFLVTLCCLNTVSATPDRYSCTKTQAAEVGANFGNMGIPKFLDGAADDDCVLTFDLADPSNTNGFLESQVYTIKLTSKVNFGMKIAVSDGILSNNENGDETTNQSDQCVRRKSLRKVNTEMFATWTAPASTAPVTLTGLCGRNNNNKMYAAKMQLVEAPTANPTVQPSASPSASPTVPQTAGPTVPGATNAPTVTTSSPTLSTSAPTSKSPTKVPTGVPTTGAPTTKFPTTSPTGEIIIDENEFPFSQTLSEGVQIFWNILSDDSDEERRVLQDEEGVKQIRVRMIRPGTQWLGFGLSAGGANKMTGPPQSDAVIGLATGVNEYALTATNLAGVNIIDGAANLKDASFTQEKGYSILDFTASQIGDTAFDPDGTNTIIYAFGVDNTLAEHAGKASAQVSWSTGSFESSTSSQYIAHGGMMLFAFMFMFPFGAVFPVLFKGKTQKGSHFEEQWFNWHRTIQVFAMVLVVAAFIVIVVHISDIDGEHFDHGHSRLGLTLLVLVVVQVCVAVFRPHEAEVGENSQQRVIWKYSHQTLGSAILIGGVVNCFLGVHELEEVVSPNEAGEQEYDTFRTFSFVGLAFAIVCVLAMVWGRMSNTGADADAYASESKKPSMAPVNTVLGGDEGGVEMTTV